MFTGSSTCRPSYQIAAKVIIGSRYDYCLNYIFDKRVVVVVVVLQSVPIIITQTNIVYYSAIHDAGLKTTVDG